MGCWMYEVGAVSSSSFTVGALSAAFSTPKDCQCVYKCSGNGGGCVFLVLSIHSVRAGPPPAGDAYKQKKQTKQKRRGTQTHTLDQATSAADVSPALRMNAGPAGQGPPLRKTHTSMPAAQRHTKNCKRGNPIDAARVSRLASRRASRVASCKPCLHHVRGSAPAACEALGLGQNKHGRRRLVHGDCEQQAHGRRYRRAREQRPACHCAK